MLSHLTRLSARRCMHTRVAAISAQTLSFRRLAMTAAGASVVASYLTWRLTSEHQRIALDSAQSSASVHKSTPQSQEPPSAKGNIQEKVDEASSMEEPSEGGSGGGGGAFNPETGEINWDCPCLGGMAQGPCGEQFRAAFSCFVFSEQELKGIDCVDKFKAMQNCFREHPEVYSDQIMDDDEDEAPASEGAALPEPAPASPKSEESPATKPSRAKLSSQGPSPSSAPPS